ncbi:MAG: OsmC family protein [Chryseolinea sp.]
MKITTRMIEEDLFESSNIHGNKVPIDMRKKPLKEGLSPVELLQAALASCAGVDVVAMLKKRKKHIEAFTIEIEAKRKEHHPRWLTDIHCSYLLTSLDVTETELTKLAHLALDKYCSVASSLKSVITISVHVIKPASHVDDTQL